MRKGGRRGIPDKTGGVGGVAVPLAAGCIAEEVERIALKALVGVVTALRGFA